MNNLKNSNPFLAQDFYENLISGNLNKCQNLINNLPSDIKNILSSHSLDINSIMNKISNLVSIVTTHFSIAIGHARELAEKDPDKAGYIFSLAAAGMLMSYIFGRRSRI
ncbi:MAG: hypothetical protein IPH62_19625 [Ignavibacteriae bacterium]|nr:hypothetical protein [Ignavibacteriota bacterium]